MLIHFYALPHNWTTCIETSGEATLTVIDGLLSDTETFTIAVEPADTTEPEGGDNTKSGNIVLYPNPVSSALFLKYNGTINTIQVISLTGNCVINEKVNTSETQLSMENLNQGIYIVKINTNDGILMQRVIKR